MGLKHVTSLCFLLSLATLHFGGASPSAKQNNKRLVCYYTNWSHGRRGEASFTPSDIDTTLCTHIIYSFATLDPNSLEMVVSDWETDIDQGYYQQVTGLKGPDVKVTIALGGWGDSAGNKYSRMVSSTLTRSNFVAKAVEFIQRYNFDGLDLDWEYPVCWQADCSAGPATDKDNFASLVRELRTAFTHHGFLLSAAVSADGSTGDRAYDIPTLSANLDWIGLMTYDMAGGWDEVTGHNSPFRRSGSSTVDTVNYWLEKGAASDKLVIGVPLYGRSFTLENPDNNGVGDAATYGAEGEYTQEAGFLAYFELCRDLAPFTHVPDVGPYGFRGNQWASFDDERIIGDKTRYVMEEDLGGALVWAIDLDDFNGNFCGDGSYPLLRALKAGLSGV